MQTSAQNYLRDSLTYLLISAGVILGIDAASHLSISLARIITLTVGGIAGYGFASAWIARRGFTDVPVDQVSQAFFASMAAIIVPLSLAVTLGLTPKIRIWWLAYSAIILIAVL